MSSCEHVWKIVKLEHFFPGFGYPPGSTVNTKIEGATLTPSVVVVAIRECLACKTQEAFIVR